MCIFCMYIIERWVIYNCMVPSLVDIYGLSIMLHERLHVLHYLSIKKLLL